MSYDYIISKFFRTANVYIVKNYKILLKKIRNLLIIFKVNVIDK